jgi:adenosine deaminase CECR1
MHSSAGVRLTGKSRFMYSADGHETVPHREWVAAFERVLNKVKLRLKDAGREHEFIGARVTHASDHLLGLNLTDGSQIIYSTIRSVSPEELQWYLDDCLQLKLEFPHLICGTLLRLRELPYSNAGSGFDLVGPENELKPLIDYLDPLLRFQERQKKEGIDIPYIFHAGETLGDGSMADMNLYDAILLGTKRIGHG